MADWGDEHTVQVCECLAPWGWTFHLKVRRRDGKDGISWDTLQAIKNEMIGYEEIAVEVYPSQIDVVNDANIRHLWTVPVDYVPNLMDYVPNLKR